ncbi:MAG TPA: protein-disulfide reductase DsbD domain-containing protein [Chryseosolibacter sp.]
MRLLWIIFLISVDAVAQSNEELVKVQVPNASARPGREGLIKILVSVKTGYHIQAHRIKDDLLIPTTLEIEGDTSFKITNQVFPPAKQFALTGTDQSLEVYDGDFEIQTSLRLSRRIQKGFRQVKGRLNYQACDSVRCLFPRTVEFPVNIEVQ